LLADTTRLQIPPQPTSNREYSQRSGNYNRTYNHNNYNHYRQGPSTRGQSNTQTNHSNPTPSTTDAAVDSTTSANATQSSLFTPQTEERPRKFTEAHQFDLNTIDSLNLIRIPGIASRTASVILKYRQRYGGFYNPWQLQEFLTWDAAKDYMEEWCNVWFTADANRLRLIHVNAATISELQRHPYISHEQAVEIVRYRTRHKRIASAVEFQQLSTFSAEQIQQLLPYLTFE
jgi:DNA uptake protein ComE-like DNA-binding protein